MRDVDVGAKWHPRTACASISCPPENFGFSREFHVQVLGKFGVDADAEFHRGFVEFQPLVLDVTGAVRSSRCHRVSHDLVSRLFPRNHADNIALVRIVGGCADVQKLPLRLGVARVVRGGRCGSKFGRSNESGFRRGRRGRRGLRGQRRRNRRRNRNRTRNHHRRSDCWRGYCGGSTIIFVF